MLHTGKPSAQARLSGPMRGGSVRGLRVFLIFFDTIVGHAPASVGRGYGEPTLADKAAALSKFPRYKV